MLLLSLLASSAVESHITSSFEVFVTSLSSVGQSLQAAKLSQQQCKCLLLAWCIILLINIAMHSASCLALLCAFQAPIPYDQKYWAHGMHISCKLLHQLQLWGCDGYVMSTLFIWSWMPKANYKMGWPKLLVFIRKCSQAHPINVQSSCNLLHLLHFWGLMNSAISALFAVCSDLSIQV